MMNTQIDHNSPDMLEILFEEFNGNNVYGLEYILDEFDDIKEGTINNNTGSTDWFGFSDLCI